jgi:hypothetical protein
MTLLILAAGMGSRYGGLKQITPVTDNGEFIIDFSVYDAVKSGFDKIVFVIKEENLEDFRNTIGKRFEDKIKVEYAFQRIDDLPEGFSVPLSPRSRQLSERFASRLRNKDITVKSHSSHPGQPGRRRIPAIRQPPGCSRSPAVSTEDTVIALKIPRSLRCIWKE